MKPEDRKRILRWTGIFSLPWVILGVLLWLAARPEKPIPGTEAVVEGRVTDMATAPYDDSLTQPYDPFVKHTRAYLILRYDDGTEEFFREADIGAEHVNWDSRSVTEYPNPRVRVTVAEERGCDARVYTRIELLPDS